MIWGRSGSDQDQKGARWSPGAGVSCQEAGASPQVRDLRAGGRTPLPGAPGLRVRPHLPGAVEARVPRLPQALTPLVGERRSPCISAYPSLLPRGRRTNKSVSGYKTPLGPLAESEGSGTWALPLCSRTFSPRWSPAAAAGPTAVASGPPVCRE